MNPIPPYEGNQPYMYFAFAEADSARVWKLLRPLLARGCRVWYCVGPAGSVEELLRRQERSAGAALTVVYLSDAICADKDAKSAVLDNQEFDRPILCLDPDEKNRSLSMNLRETIPHIPLYQLSNSAEWENAILHADGFSQDMIGEPIKIKAGGGLVKKLTLAFCVLAVLVAAVTFVGYRYLNWFRPASQDEEAISFSNPVPEKDEIIFRDPTLQTAVQQAVGSDAITEEQVLAITTLRFEELPESWEELALLPSLERISLPQQALLAGGEVPDGDYVIELNGGDGS